jgi:hypothetical protein
MITWTRSRALGAAATLTATVTITAAIAASDTNPTHEPPAAIAALAAHYRDVDARLDTFTSPGSAAARYVAARDAYAAAARSHGWEAPEYIAEAWGTTVTIRNLETDNAEVLTDFTLDAQGLITGWRGIAENVATDPAEDATSALTATLVGAWREDSDLTAVLHVTSHRDGLIPHDGDWRYIAPSGKIYRPALVMSTPGAMPAATESDWVVTLHDAPLGGSLTNASQGIELNINNNGKE